MESGDSFDLELFKRESSPTRSRAPRLPLDKVGRKHNLQSALLMLFLSGEDSDDAEDEDNDNKDDDDEELEGEVDKR